MHEKTESTLKSCKSLLVYDWPSISSPPPARTVTINTCSVITQSLSSIMSEQTLPAVQQTGSNAQQPNSFYELYVWCSQPASTKKTFVVFSFSAPAAESCRGDACVAARCAQLCRLWLFTAVTMWGCAVAAPLVSSRCSSTPLICVITRRLSFIVPFPWVVAECSGKHDHLGLQC